MTNWQSSIVGCSAKSDYEMWQLFHRNWCQ